MRHPKPLIPKRTINPALIAALEHFASRQYDWNKPTVFRYTTPDGLRRTQEDWPVERTCAIAHEVLESYELHFLELKQLKEGLKQLGLERAYERITGEKLE